MTVRAWRTRGRAIAAVAASAVAMAVAVAATPAAAADPPSATVLIGFSGVTWSDVSSTTPRLAELAADSRWAVGLMSDRSVRAIACPIDGWLAVSAAGRATDTRVAGPGELDFPSADDCGVPAEPVAGQIPGWSELTALAEQNTPTATLATLTTELDRHAVAHTAVGPGAALALAASSGSVSSYLPAPDDAASLGTAVSAALEAARGGVVVVDAGMVLTSRQRPSRAIQLADLDARIAAALDAALAGGADHVVLTSLADDGSGASEQVALARIPEADTPAWLGSPSAGRDEIAQTTDLTATLLAWAGIDPEHLGTDPADASRELPPVPGSILRATSTGDAEGRAAVLADRAAHIKAQTGTPAAIAALLALAAIAVTLGAALTVRRAARHPETPPARALRWWRRVGLWAAWLPVATLLANLAPWWRLPLAQLWVMLASVALAAGLAAACWVLTARRAPLAPWAVVGAATALAWAWDVVTANSLSFAGPLGSSILAAARFYGMGNTGFALLGVGAVMACSAGYLAARRHGEGRGDAFAAVAVGLIGATLTFTDGVLGADFGGIAPLVVAFGALTCAYAGVRLTWRSAGLVVAAAVVGLVVISVSDWLRGPTSWSHLGSFVDSLVHGDAGATLHRKLGQNLTWLAATSPALIVGGVALWACWRAVRHTTAWAELRAASPKLAPGCLSIAAVLVVGSAMNDSGMVIVGVGVALALPALAVGLITAALRAPDVAEAAPVVPVAAAPEWAGPPEPDLTA